MPDVLPYACALIGIGVVSLLVAYLYRNNYYNFDDEHAFIIFKRLNIGKGKFKGTNHRIVIGKSAFIIPLFENVKILRLGEEEIAHPKVVSEGNERELVMSTHAKDGCELIVHWTMFCKIIKTEDAVESFADRFIVCSLDEIREQLIRLVHARIGAESSVRTYDEIRSELPSLSEKVRNEFEGDLADYGLECVEFRLKEVTRRVIVESI